MKLFGCEVVCEDPEIAVTLGAVLESDDEAELVAKIPGVKYAVVMALRNFGPRRPAQLKLVIKDGSVFTRTLEGEEGPPARIQAPREMPTPTVEESEQ